jgi:hypothetical protein
LFQKASPFFLYGLVDTDATIIYYQKVLNLQLPVS